MATQQFTYVFTTGSYTDVIVATVSTPATNSTGFGQGYAITSITGDVGGAAITQEVGKGGASQPGPYDNTIFTSNSSGSNGFSYDGIDFQGIEFAVGSIDYNLFAVSTTELELGEGNGFGVVTLILSNAPCYCAGTRIMTSRGEIPVEALEIGDTVVTAFGAHRPIEWIGRRSYAGRFLAANPQVQPVRFRAGCLGDGLPRRDLLVSPEHAMFLDGVLVPARCVVNGSTIVQERGRERVDYFHIELDRHDVLLAEGAPSESFVDDDSRAMFQNVSEWTALPPGRGRGAAVYCAPKVEAGHELEAVRRRLAVLDGELAQAA